MMAVPLATRGAVLAGFLLAIAGCLAPAVDWEFVDPVPAVLAGGPFLAALVVLATLPILRRPAEQVPMWTHAVGVMAALVLGLLVAAGPLLLGTGLLPGLAWGLALPGFASAWWLHRGLPRH